MGRISFQKRQKEMKRQEKQQMKAEKRAQRKLAKNGEPGSEQAGAGPAKDDSEEFEVMTGPAETEPEA